MIKEVFSFTGQGGVPLPALLWRPTVQPIAILQVAHGMTEHMQRYQEFAEALVSHGIAVAGFDLRGHGQHPGDPLCASMGEEGWEATLQDMRLFFRYLDSRFPELPHYMLGFSLGSFLLREYLGKYPEGVSGAVIAGTGQQPQWLLSVMMAIVRTQISRAGFDNTTDLIRKLSFGVYNDKFKPNRTTADWLCSDGAQLEAYLSDPLCRKDISAGLFRQLLGSMKRTGSVSSYASWNKELPILLLSGTCDPVGDMGKGAAAVEKTMAQAGLTGVTRVMFPDARHDLFHEKANGTADAVAKAIVQWMNP